MKLGQSLGNFINYDVAKFEVNRMYHEFFYEFVNE